MFYVNGMLELSESKPDAKKSALYWIAAALTVVGGGLIFVDFRSTGLLPLIAGQILLSLDDTLKRREPPPSILHSTKA